MIKSNTKNYERKVPRALFGVWGFLVFVLIFSLTFPFTLNAAAGVPSLISFQGRLADDSGNLLGGAGTEYCFKFALYDASTGGSKVWPTGAPSTTTLTVREGVFDAYIGSADTLDFAFTDDLAYVDVEVATKVGATCAAGDGAEVFESLSPRPRVVSAGYAINSRTVGGFTPAQSATNNQIPALTSGLMVLGHATGAGVQSVTTAPLLIDTGTTGTLNLGTGNNAKTINLGTGTAGNTINIGTDNTTKDTITIGSALDDVAIASDSWSITNAGALTVVSCSGCGGVSSWSDITAPTATQSLTFNDAELNAWTIESDTETFHSYTANSLTTGKVLELSSSSISSGTLLDLIVTGTAGATGQKALNITLSGNNASGSQTTYGGYISNTHGGSGTNIGLYATASGGTNNYAAIFENGNVGIGTTAPSVALDVLGRASISFAADNLYISGGNSDTVSTENIAIGAGTLASLDDGHANVGLGIGALGANTSGSNNVAIGYLTSQDNTTGGGNVALGYLALRRNQTGQSNVVIGDSAGASFGGNITGNSIIGTGAGYLLNGGDYNTLVGYQAGVNLTSGNRNIIIGYNLNAPSATGSDQLNIGNLLFGTGLDGVFSTLSSGNIGIGLNNPSYRFDVLNAKTAQTASTRVANFSNSGATFNTTSGALNSYGGYFSSTSTRSAGSNDLTNIGLYATASGAQHNYAAIFESGRVGIGVTTPVALLDVNGDTIISGSSRYLNFGTTSGTSGYGFRDNAGTMEFKNNAGSWTAFGTGGSLTIGTSPIASGVVGRILFEGSGNVLQQSAGLTWDNTDASLVLTTASTTSANKALNVSQTGATSGTDYAGYFSNTGAATTNIGLYATASGGTTNLGLNVDSGQTLLGGTTLTTGTLAKLNIVSTMSSSGSTTAIAGIHGDYTFNNGGTASYVQVGNRFVFNNAPTTNSNTMVGEIIRTVDNTTLANLVRGIEVTSNAGSNTAGTNTGIRTTGATFGIQAVTTALAGGVYIPAAIYGESSGTTQGDILRLYTTTMTTAPQMAYIYHDTSTYSGTSLMIDMATGSGTFSGNFADFQKNNTTMFKVDNAGLTSVTLASSSGNYALCHDTNGTGLDAIKDCSGSPQADYAEMYPVEEGVEYGDIVMLGEEIVLTYEAENGSVNWQKVKGNIKQLVKADRKYSDQVVGIVVDNYGDFSSTGYNIKEEDNPMPVALSGRVPVKIAKSSKYIKAGDYITSSAEEGRAMKAEKAGFVIGKALEDWDPAIGYEFIMVYVEQGHWNGASYAKLTGLTQEAGSETMSGRIILTKIMEDEDTIQITAVDVSEIFTDRLIAGLEVVTPLLTANAVDTNKLNVEQEALFKGLVSFSNTAVFEKGVSFGEQTEFLIPPIFNKDTAGFALIREGDNQVKVEFEKTYATTPVVTVSVTFESTDNIDAVNADTLFAQDVRYVVTDKNVDGFTILINKKAPQNIRFSWIALGVRDASVFESLIDGLVIDGEDVPVVDNTPAPSAPAPSTEENISAPEGESSQEISNEESGEKIETETIAIEENNLTQEVQVEESTVKEVVEEVMIEAPAPTPAPEPLPSPETTVEAVDPVAEVATSVENVTE